MKLLKLNEIRKERDVVEFLYPCNAESLWNEDSVYMSYEDFSFLSKSLESLKKFNCYGPNIITITQWNMIRNEISKPENINSDSQKILNFFSDLDGWIEIDPDKSDYFIIDGI